MAFLYDRNSETLLTDHVYGVDRNGGGRWFVNLGFAFDYTFPRAAQRMKLNDEADADDGPVHARLYDGLAVEMAVSYQYELERDSKALLQLLRDFGAGPESAKQVPWEHVLVQVTRSATRDVLGEYRVYDLWGKRDEIAADIRAELEQLFEQFHCRVVGLQLLSLTVPVGVQRAIENTTVQEQRIEQVQVLIDTERVRKEMQVAMAELETDTIVIQAESDAYVQRRLAEAQAASILLAAEADANVLNAYKDISTLNNTQLLQLLFLDAVSEAKTARGLLINVPKPELLEDDI
jgi:regulator of protease activity HflC (stomatin/prohibitin superfamily)